MPISYGAQGGVLGVCEHFASTTLHPDILKLGTGTETFTRVTGTPGRNGIVRMGTGASVGNSAAIAYGVPLQPSLRLTEGGPLKASMGGGHLVVRLGFTALAGRRLFVGWVEEPDAAPISANLQVNDLVGETGDVLTYPSGAPEAAGFYLDPGFTDGDQLRMFYTNGPTNGNAEPVKADFAFATGTNPNDGTSDKMPALSVNIDQDGDVHFAINGDMQVDKFRDDGQNRRYAHLTPDKAYLAVVILEASTGGAKDVWLDYFEANFSAFQGLPRL